MGISYDPTKPAAANKPTNDQPAMQTNFASIKTLIDIDHVDFSSADYGEHVKVTFSGSNPPSLPSAQLVLFASVVAGLPQLFAYSGDAAHSSTQYAAAGNGSTFLLGGIIVKWGVAMTGTVSFVSAFPNNCFVVVCTAQSGLFPVTASGYTQSSFTAVAGAGITFSYVAIGN